MPTTTASPPLNVGLLGYGFAGQTFHAPLIQAAPGLRLAAVASGQPERVQADWPGVAVLPTPQALMARADIDLVVVATPNDSHAPLAEAALRAGKHVVVDKPFTLDVAQAEALAALATAQQRVLSVFHNRRWDGDFLTVQQLLATGELGRVRLAEFHFDRFRPLVRQRWRESAALGGGLWFDLGPHLLDQALQLWGWPDAIRTELSTHRDGAVADDAFDTALHYDQGPHAGLRVRLAASQLTALARPRFALHGTRGSFVKHGLDTQEDALRAGARPTWPAQADWGVDPCPGRLCVPESSVPEGEFHPGEAGNYMRYYAAVAEALRGTGPNPVPPPQAIDVMRLIELGRHSHAERRALPTAR
ncbi:MAG: hypothetical protein RJA98_3632 [Pseudomonadota bacterium]|jgi:predicted dehydrogenase